MISLDEGALICDLAETYHVFDWRALPARTAATLAMGLGPDSRIIRKMCNISLPIETMLLVTIADALHLLVWQNTRDGRRGRNRPELIAERLTGRPAEEGFLSVEEFKAWREEMTGGKQNG